MLFSQIKYSITDTPSTGGSVATIKLANIIRGLESLPNLSIRLVLTESATHFLSGETEEQPTVDEISRLPSVDAVYTDASEWVKPWKRNAPIMHIELRRWADVLVIAPLSANTMAKIVNGMCDCESAPSIHINPRVLASSS